MTRSEQARLRQLGRLVNIGIVQAGKTKRQEATRARDLYTGSLFVASRRWAETRMDDWVILSAEHGVLDPDAIVSPYCKSLRSLNLRERVAWGKVAADSITRRYRGMATLLHCVASDSFVELLDPFIDRLLLCPVAKLNMGERIRWFTSECEKGNQGGI